MRNMDKATENKQAQEKKKKPFIPPPPPHDDEEKKEDFAKRKVREQKPFVQVDRGGNMISNFISNYLKQLNNPNHIGLLGLLNKLLRSKKPKEEPKPQQADEVVGKSKTVFENGKAKPQYGGAPKNHLQSAQDNRQANDNHLEQKQKDEPKVIPITEPKNRALRR